MPDLPDGQYGGFRADSSSCHQLSSRQKQVAEGEQREELSMVLGETAVAGLHVAELALHHSERMLDLRAIAVDFGAAYGVNIQARKHPLSSSLLLRMDIERLQGGVSDPSAMPLCSTLAGTMEMILLMSSSRDDLAA